MLNSFVLLKYFWPKVVNTACYVLNCIIIRPILKKTPYELFFEKTPNIFYLKFLDVSVLFLILKIIWVNLIPSRMKVYFMAISLQAKLIECLINAH